MGAKRPTGSARLEEQLVSEWKRYVERRLGKAERAAEGACYLESRPCPFEGRPDFETRFVQDCVHCARVHTRIEAATPAVANAAGVIPTLGLLLRLVEEESRGVAPGPDGDAGSEESRYRSAAFLFRGLPLLHSTQDPDRIGRLLLAAAAGAFPDSVDTLLYYRVAPDANALVLAAALRLTDRSGLDDPAQSLLDLDAVEEGSGFDGALFDRLRETPLALEPDRDLLADAVFDGRTALVPSAARELRIPTILAEHLPDGPLAVLPIFGRERVHGVLVISGALGVAGWTSTQIELLGAMATQAGIALDGITLTSLARRRGAALASLLDLSRGGAAPETTDARCEAALRALVPATEAAGGLAWVRRGDDAPTLAAALGLDSEASQGMSSVAETLLAWFDADPRPLRVDSIASDPRFSGEVPDEWASVLAFPLLEEGRVVGVGLLFAVADGEGRASAAFGAEDARVAELVSLSLSLSSNRFARAEALRTSERKAHELEAQLRHAEKLAVVGERGIQVAQDIRNPVAAITGFARRVLKSLGETDANREYVEIILRETERLERILTEQIALAQLTRPRLKLENVNALVQEVLQAQSEDLVRRRVRLLKRLAPDVPNLLIDHEKMRQVLANILNHALQSVPSGGRVRLETRASMGAAQIEIAHDGPKVAGEMLDRLFVPFSMSRRYGSGVGLAASYQIVREHGGEIRARSEGDWGSIVTVYLPIRENEDRRNRPDRRGGRSERRRRPA
jgi:signal transduction histidine kinase